MKRRKRSFESEIVVVKALEDLLLEESLELVRNSLTKATDSTQQAYVQRL